jgi:hypothetical protein
MFNLLVTKYLRWVKRKSKESVEIKSYDKFFSIPISDENYRYSEKILELVKEFVRGELDVELDTIIVLSAICIETCCDPKRIHASSDVCFRVMKIKNRYIGVVFLGEIIEETGVFSLDLNDFS